jgi:hypothetical protein
MKIKDIKEISLDSVRLLTEFGSPEMTESLDIIKEITVAAQGLTESLEDPKMVNNIEKMRLAFKSIQEARDRMKNVFSQVAETGIIDEAKNTTHSIKNKIGSINSEQNSKELITAFKEAAKSFNGLAAELKRPISV